MRRKLSLLLGSLLFALLPAGATYADVNNFSISDYDIDYTLSRDSEQRSTLQARETITAVFPMTNQNHGIERAIPRTYNGHPTSLKVTSVTDQNGNNRPFTTYAGNDHTIVRIGKSDTYVHGAQTYIIDYAQRDVTRYFEDTSSDEFYWNTNGTQWRVPIRNLSVSLTVDGSIAPRLSSNAACYQGGQGSTDTCTLDRDGATFTASANNLAAGENMTLAVGFAPETFAAYQAPWWQLAIIAWVIVQIVLIPVVIGLITWLAVRYYRVSGRRSELHPIAPEYLPPPDASVEVAGKLLGKASAFSALLIDLAVRRYITIRELKPKSLLRAAEYEIEIIKPVDDLRPEEYEIVKDTFPSDPIVGAKLNMRDFQKNTTAYIHFLDNPKKLQKLVRGTYGLKEQQPKKAAWFTRFSVISLIAAIVLLSPGLLIVSIVAFIMKHTLWILTDKGLALVRYLRGLEMYIKVGEAERLRMLQSPEGAEKVGDTSDESKLIKLYEKTLPYAVLFGLEKDWNKQLGLYYQSTNSQPDWFVGTPGSTFSAATFSSALSSFSSSAGYSSPSSSSSGGSSGGGFSGGGGGGGGGGGW